MADSPSSCPPEGWRSRLHSRRKSKISPFRDVPTDAYYYEAVKWAQKKGITGGIGDGLFGPNQPCTRAQIVTFLWRAAGAPVVNYAMDLTDVPSDAYYAEAVRWALSQGITTGTADGRFAPDATCTRAQGSDLPVPGVQGIRRRCACLQRCGRRRLLRRSGEVGHGQRHHQRHNKLHLQPRQRLHESADRDVPVAAVRGEVITIYVKWTPLTAKAVKGVPFNL